MSWGNSASNHTYSRTMFTSSKHNASPPLPSSTQLSANSFPLGTDPSTSTFELWPSNGSDASLPEQYVGAHAGRRNSGFNLRARSDTSMSASSSWAAETPPSTAGNDTASRRISQDIHHLAGQSFMDINGTKRSIFRGKKGKRASSSFASSLNSNEVEEMDVGSKRASILRRTKKSNSQSEGSGQNLKDRISSPFGFQHLTHTDRHQFATLRQVSKDELVAEYWAVRAAQAPRRDLTGIKAEDLHTGSHSSPALGLKDVSMGSEPISKQEEHVQSLVTPTTRPTLRSARSVESFSRPGVPGVKPQLHRHTQSANAPPRSSSRSHMTPMNCLPEDSAVAQRSPPAARRPSRQSGNWEHFALSPSSPSGQLSTMTEEADYVGHALTTPDNSAIHPNSPPFTPGLDDVAEEPERFVSPRAAPQPPVQDSKPHKSPSFDSFSFSKQQSPIAKSYDRRSPYTSPKSSNQMTTTRRSSSQISDTLGSPGLSRKPSVSSPPTTRTKSNNTWRVIEESWEDDIDYIYDNALEADCDFDWDSKSFGRRSEDVDRTAEQQVHNQTSSATCYTTKSQFLSPAKKPVTHNKFTQGAKRPVLVVPSANHAPEPRSAVSTSTIETPGAHTPSDFYNPLADAGYSSHLAEGFCLTPSLLIPQDFKNELAQEENYDDLFEDYEESDRHFPLIETNSTRSSHVRSSKRSSDDSSFMSSGQASGSWTSGVRRSASSSGSLPELVHSSRHARENFNSVVDHLSQQVASFTSFDEHDDEKNEANMTPPGHTSQQRTFFAFDDEQVEEDHFRQASVKDGVKNSLELARQGSTRSRAPLPNHKYSNSDGATKMLMSASSQTAPERQPPTKSRHRAASSSNVQRKPREKYFNLFPTPPRHSPLSTPTTTPLDHASMRL